MIATLDRCVVDASVIGAIAFEEPEADRAAALIDGLELFAPALLDYELASIARTKIRRSPEKRALILRSLADGLAMAINRTEVIHDQVVRLALDVGLSTYDASYVWLARELSAPLVSFDKRLNAAAAGK